LPVDISERLSEIIPILSFLRVLRSDVQKPSHRAGFFFERVILNCLHVLITDVVMRRDLNKVRHLLELLEKRADEKGMSRQILTELWKESGKDAVPPLDTPEFSYLIARTMEAGLISHGSHGFQLTWNGHEWLDRNRKTNF